MPKRKRSDREYERIKKKLKKLERKLERKHRRSSSSSVASTGSQEDNQDVFLESGIEKDLLYDLRTDIEAPPGTQLLEIEDELTTVPEAPQQQPTITLTSALLSEPTAVTTAETQEAIVADLDEVALEILGVDPSVPISHVKNGQKDLAIRFDYLASSGLDKSLRKELLEKYLPPGNCYSINAPILNPEIKAALTEVVIKRDKAFFDKQKQTASAISSLSQAITLMLQKDDKDPVLLKTLMDTGRLLCDSQYSESITRRNFILPVLKKELRTQLQQTKIDKFLFSEKLSDALKTAKAIHQSGAELKLPSNFKPLFRKPKPGPIKNWKGPPLNRRPAPPRAQPSGTSRTTQPAQTKPQRWQSSKGSQQTPFNNRR